MSSDSTPLNQPQGWGSIEEVLKEAPQNVAPDAGWCSVLGMWLTLPINLIQGILGGLCGCIYRQWAFAGCCCTLYDSVMKDRPLYMAFIWWRGVIAGLVALIQNGKSRLALFLWGKEACGGGEYFWQGEGVWATSYDLNAEIMRSLQDRGDAFACIRACVPDLFAERLLIFLPTGGPASEWAALRSVLHGALLDRDLPPYRERQQQLRQKIGESWPAPKAADLDDKALLQRTVARSVFFMMFGAWLSDDEAEALRGWRTLASFFVLPRLVQRFLFNVGIGKVKALRKRTVEIVEAHKLQEVFIAMNNSLPSDFRRTPTVKLCDQIMYVIGFAGIGGTSACVESAAQFLQLKTGEVPKDKVDFSKFASADDMLAAYRADPVSYIKEVCRLDPPVTSATSVLKEALEVEMAGRRLAMPAGSLRQYTLSLANRDPKVFEQPSLFDPSRSSLGRALTWNGEIDAGESAYPRICPGRYLSLEVAQAILDHAVTALRAGP